MVEPGPSRSSSTTAPRRRSVDDRALSRVAATQRGFHDRLAALDPDRAPTFDPRRTLRLRVEFERQLRRRRTQVAFGLLLVLLIAGAAAASFSIQVTDLMHSFVHHQQYLRFGLLE